MRIELKITRVWMISVTLQSLKKFNNKLKANHQRDKKENQDMEIQK